jgi:hypothetical protein
MALTLTEKYKLRSAIKATLTKLGPQTVDQIRNYIMSKWTEIPESHLHHGTIYSVLKTNPDLFEDAGFKSEGKVVWRKNPKSMLRAKVPEPADPSPLTVKSDDQKLFEKTMLSLVASGQPDVKRAQEIVAAIRKAEGVKNGRYLYDPVLSLHMNLRVQKATPGIPARLEFTTPDGCTYLFDVADIQAQLDKIK